MSKRWHKIFIIGLILIVAFVLIYLFIKGSSYYNTSIENRFFNPDYEVFKPSGSLGHGLGIIGSILIIIGVSSYMLRKRSKRLQRIGVLKHWLEFHIFLCILGPIMILYHTSFKFGGVVSISFWSMVAVFLSGIIGRYIYIQIPRTIEGRELSLFEVQSLKSNLKELLSSSSSISEETTQFILNSARSTIIVQNSNALSRYIKGAGRDRQTLRKIKHLLQDSELPRNEYKTMVKLIGKELSLNRRIERLDTMKNLFKYWHVAHLPFALVMLIIMIIHVVITITLGYKWVF
jgi:hypothetical protein